MCSRSLRITPFSPAIARALFYHVLGTLPLALFECHANRIDALYDSRSGRDSTNAVPLIDAATTGRTVRTADTPNDFEAIVIGSACRLGGNTKAFKGNPLPIGILAQRNSGWRLLHKLAFV